ncbi:MAG: hypothetical protein AB7K71_39730 [Polyangiaceae bacterium]
MTHVDDPPESLPSSVQAPGSYAQPQVVYVAVPSKPARGPVFWLLLVGGLATAGVLFVGLIAVIAFGLAHLESVKDEGRTNAVALAQVVATCHSPLPPSSTPVPAQMPEDEYRSSPWDWDQPAFSCTDQRPVLREPLNMRYRWVNNGPESGVVVAEIDLDLDGELDGRVEVDVRCSGGSCRAGAPQLFDWD